MNNNLREAKAAKNDEFYTQYRDIEHEINAYLEYDPDVFRGKTILCPCDDPEWSKFTLYFAQRFEYLGLKKLISTSYAQDAKKLEYPYSPSLFETENEHYEESKTQTHGKIFVLDGDRNKDGHIDYQDIDYTYLEGTGDFRSEEVTKLRDEADIIVTNPPFSLFREFVSWIMEADKQFLIIGNMNAITYKEIFPLLKENKIWFGSTIHSGDREFRVPPTYEMNAAGQRIDENGNKFIRVKGVRWFTNMEHGRRHEPMMLMTYEDNQCFSKHKVLREEGYKKYDNYAALNVDFTDAIPEDYDGVMGVPISFMDRYCPEQFEILWIACGNTYANAPKEILEELKFDPTMKYGGGLGTGIINGKAVYSRILIRHIKK